MPERNDETGATSTIFRPAAARLADIVRPRLELTRLAARAGRPLVVAVLATNVLIGLGPLVFTLAMSAVVGSIPAAVAAGSGSPAWQRLTVAFAIAAGASLTQQLFTPVRAALGEVMARRIDGHIYDRLLRASLLTADITPLENQDTLDQLAEARRELENSSETPGRGCAGQLALIGRYLHLSSLVVAVGVAFSWWAALGVLATTLMFRNGQRGGLRRYSSRLITLIPARRRTDYLYELSVGASAAKEIRVFGLVEWLTRTYREAKLGWMGQLWAARREIYFKQFMVYVVLGILIIGSVLASVGVAAPADLSLAQTALVLQAVLAAVGLGVNYPESDVVTQLGINGYNAVRAFEARVCAAVAAADAGATPATVKEIRLEQVSFRYPGAPTPVLDGLDLVIPPGRVTAIVGANGAGKTTLVKLLTRLYAPTAGAIVADGTDIGRFPVDQWRRRIAVVFQDFLRYEVSVADNIGFGAVEHLDDEDGIREAARAANLMSVVDRLPARMATPLARHVTGGTDLSGGQWQRVAIARALFAVRHGASILILDEPTASLDVRAEARFYKEFVRTVGDVTTVLISHRFSTVRLADNIVVLSEGQVLEQGSHDQLMAAAGRYAELFQLQAMRFTDDDTSEEPA